MTKIRILAAESNLKGDLFTKAMQSLLGKMGFTAEVGVNVQYPGSEIDLVLRHTEEHWAVVECKAHMDPIGGRELNTFFGALERQSQRSAPHACAGYFISLNGFTQTAIEQEKISENQRMTLWDGPAIIERLVEHKLIRDQSFARSRANECAKTTKIQGDPHGAELLLLERLGTSEGSAWIWAFFYGRAKQRSHVALIDEQGIALVEKLGAEVIVAYKVNERSDEEIIYLAPPQSQPFDKVREAYVRTLESAYERLPPGFVRRRLVERDTAAKVPPPFVEEILKKKKRLAIVAPHRSGKTTLLVWLAREYMAQSQGGRFDELPQDLPALALFVRCSQVASEFLRGPFAEVLRRLAPTADARDTFTDLIAWTLRNGRVLLLVDELDEITDPVVRDSFVQNLAAYIDEHPVIRVVVTSSTPSYWEAGKPLARSCTVYTLDKFAEQDIEHMVKAWYGSSVDAANKAIRAIKATPEMQEWAEEPVLLPVLLQIIKNQSGILPNRRSELYEKAVQTLLQSASGEEERARLQLGTIALQMRRAGQPHFAESDLQAWLQEDDAAFIKCLTETSSLLLRTPESHTNGQLNWRYAFSHPIFPQYLAAWALIKEDENCAGQPLAERLEPYLNDEHWQEVIVLAAMLADRRGEPLMAMLVERSPSLLSRYVLQGGRLRPEHMKIGLKWIIRHCDVHADAEAQLISLVNRNDGEPFLKEFVAIAEELLAESPSYRPEVGMALEVARLALLRYAAPRDLTECPLNVNQKGLLNEWLADVNLPVRAGAVLALMRIAFDCWSALCDPAASKAVNDLKSLLQDLADSVRPLLEKNDLILQFGACWALAWLAASGLKLDAAAIAGPLTQLWKAAPQPSLATGAILAELPVLPNMKRVSDLAALPWLTEFLNKQRTAFHHGQVHTDAAAKPTEMSLLIGYCLGAPWEQAQIGMLIDQEPTVAITLTALRQSLRMVQEPALPQAWQEAAPGKEP